MSTSWLYFWEHPEFASTIKVDPIVKTKIRAR
jgi:hypothetical protein